MPDLIHSLTPDIKPENVVWYDEICASCKGVSKCPLITVMMQNHIMTYSGVHVSNCDLYDPDTTSQYYLPPEAGVEDMSNLRERELERLLGQVDKMFKGLTNVITQ